MSRKNPKPVGLNMKQIHDRYHVIHLNFPLSTYEQFSDGENNTMSPEYVQMEVDQNQNYIEGPQPGCSKQVSSTFKQTSESNGKVCILLSAHSYC
ncbi:uncharacterized protein LOC143204466 isoform X2 [Rhynchophorus ferrugineus]|uniref:uncharacterized protein LOC143204466 isoform X2 n=1 Tax=Rhynchophorus ferrugineus TaxID=354439 RepID=UPI003FCD9CB7